MKTKHTIIAMAVACAVSTPVMADVLDNRLSDHGARAAGQEGLSHTYYHGEGVETPRTSSAQLVTRTKSAGGSCGSNGQLAKSTNGTLLNCVSGKWKDSTKSSPYADDPRKNLSGASVTTTKNFSYGRGKRKLYCFADYNPSNKTIKVRAHIKKLNGSWNETGSIDKGYVELAYLANKTFAVSLESSHNVNMADTSYKTIKPITYQKNRANTIVSHALSGIKVEINSGILSCSVFVNGQSSLTGPTDSTVVSAPSKKLF